MWGRKREKVRKPRGVGGWGVGGPLEFEHGWGDPWSLSMGGGDPWSLSMRVSDEERRERREGCNCVAAQKDKRGQNL